MIRIFILSASALSLVFPAMAQPTANVAAANKAALREPSRAGYIAAVQVYPYAEGALYRLYAAPARVTHIALQPSEAVPSVAARYTVHRTGRHPTIGHCAGKPPPLTEQPFPHGRTTTPLVTNHPLASPLALYRSATKP